MSFIARDWTATRRYGTSLLVTAVALAVRMALEPVIGAKWPFLGYALAVMVAARFGGVGPGLVSTAGGVAAVWFFMIETRHSFAMDDPREFWGLGVFALVGAGISLLSGQLRNTLVGLQNEAAGRKQAQERTSAVLESISDGFNAFDREWRYAYVNAAGARMVGKTPEELLGKCVWDLWPHAFESPFGVAYRRCVEENTPLVVESFYPEPLNAWFEVRCYPSRDGLSLFFTDTTERRRTQEQLRLLEQATMQTGDGVLIVKVAGDTVCCQEPIFVNPAFERMTGYGVAELRDHGFEKLYGLRPNPHMQIGRSIGFRDACPGISELRIAHRDGSELWTELSVETIGADGNTHCVWTLRDITERRRAAEASGLLISIVESSDDAIFSKNLDGMVLSWNRGAQAIYGYSAEEMLGRHASTLMLPGRENDDISVSEDVKSTRAIVHCEAERMRKDGRRIIVSLTVSPIRDDAGNVAGTSVIARDITAQKREQEHLRLSEERYRSLVSASAQIVFNTNARGEVEDDLPHWRAFTGQSIDQVKGWGRLDAIHIQDRARAQALWADALRDGSHYTCEYRVRRYDGEYRDMTSRGVPVLESDGSVREWIGASSDITDTRLAEEEVRRLNAELEQRVVERTAELQAANKELEAFAYSVSHDLRAPLRAVDGFSRILLEEYGPKLDEEARHYLEVARRNAVQMGDLIDGLLAFSRLGRRPVRKQLVAPSDLARQAWDDLSVERQGRKVEMVLHHLPPCRADPLLLRQVFVNLLSNALKFTRTRPLARIELSTAPDDGASITYVVCDNGVGFDMLYADKLFGVFQRLHRAEEYEGTGIGLANVQRLVHKHGGSVWAWGAVDQGAKFFFRLPKVNEEQEQPQT